ncbi:hypothetical protein JI752_017985 [Lysobacter sp. MMG2]|uniref:hypothetical protein n=1 Tax=Lysobacter sp. MMG2 TaxID=2801338 RepID=UPI001C236C06|nr:hypothetical protein [Lysobacter sp. MMG2]MBU8978043.1 hypothetical protein [Lysobacter sp. MMG2]
MLIKTSPRRAPLHFSFPLLACILTAMLASCVKDGAEDKQANATASQAQPAFVAPQDVFERSAVSIVGISYPPGLERYPDLARLLVTHADARRAVLDNALKRNPQPAVPYELTLRFSTVADAPRMFAVAVDEEMYDGGMTSQPAHATFLWLPAEQRLMPPDEMIPNPAAWARLHEYIIDREREESAMLGGVAQAQAPAPAPTRAMQHVFNPRFNSAGRIAGLRFRVADGDEVEVPGALLKPLVAPTYADWFDDTPPAPAVAATATASL